jgi:hypothetical protein
MSDRSKKGKLRADMVTLQLRFINHKLSNRQLRLVLLKLRKYSQFAGPEVATVQPLPRVSSSGNQLLLDDLLRYFHFAAH